MKKFIVILLLFISVNFSVIDNVFARAGGGGGSGGGGSSSGDGGGSILALPVLLAIWAIQKIRRAKLVKKAKKDLEAAQSSDSSWNADEFKSITSNTFYKYQEARSNKNLISIENLLHPEYFKKASELMNIKLNGLKNIILLPEIISTELLSIKDNIGQDGDLFVMEISAKMIDYTINETSNDFVCSTLNRHENESMDRYISRAKTEASEFTEYWVFSRLNGNWLLFDIKQEISLVQDLLKKPESELNEILENEKNSEDVDDSVFYK